MSRSLCVSAARGDVELLEQVLSGELGDLHPEDLDQALTRAAQNGNTECVSRLLTVGADRDYGDEEDGDTPLMLAAANDHVETVILLLRYGCDIDLQSDRDRTALHLAAWNQNMRVVQLLLDAGCNINLQDCYGDSPFMLAARRGYADVLKALLVRPECDITLTSDERDTALHYAARYGQVQCLQVLMNQKLDLDPRTYYAHTPLYYAAYEGHEQCAKVLLEAGADCTAADKAEKTILHHCAKRNLVRSMKYILQKGINPNIADVDGNTPLFETILQENIMALKVLIQYGANIHVIGKHTIKGKYNFCSALELALFRNSMKIAEMLVCAGATSKDLQIFCAAHPNISFEENIYSWIVDNLNDAPSLQSLSRCVIRESLLHNLPKRAAALPLPTVLKNYISFEDIFQPV